MNQGRGYRVQSRALCGVIALPSERGIQPSGADSAPCYRRSRIIPIVRDEERRLRAVKEFARIQQVVNGGIRIEPRRTDSKYRVTLIPSPFFLTRRLSSRHLVQPAFPCRCLCSAVLEWVVSPASSPSVPQGQAQCPRCFCSPAPPFKPGFPLHVG